MKQLLILLLPYFVLTQFATADEPNRERIEWADMWVTDADKDDLPRVLVIGDSITRGYFGEVEKHLAGKAYCARLTTSKGVSDLVENHLDWSSSDGTHFKGKGTAAQGKQVADIVAMVLSPMGKTSK